MCRVSLVMLMATWVAANREATWAAYVLPQMGGGQVSQVGAGMKHADITLVGTTLSVNVDSTVATPLLRPLTAPDAFDPAMPWHVLQDRAHNFQYGWNASGFWAPPPGSAVWIEQLDATPGLEVYYVAALPVSPPYDPIFGTEGSPIRWKWNGFMTHNAYAVLNPIESAYQATYKVYLGDSITSIELPGYDSAQVQFQFQAHPLLTADFNDSLSVGSDDLSIWREGFGLSSGATRSQGDTNADGDVDGDDLLDWQRQYEAAKVLAAGTAGNVPEPSAITLAIGAAVMSATRRHRR